MSAKSGNRLALAATGSLKFDRIVSWTGIVVPYRCSVFVCRSFAAVRKNNDVFLPVLRSYKFFDLKIYDRWGQELFHSSSAQTGWDGTYKAEPCKEGTYTWVIELSTSKGEKVSKSGVVVLVR